jgi:tetratricopeptide (TPR) repeat protein
VIPENIKMQKKYNTRESIADDAHISSSPSESIETLNELGMDCISNGKFTAAVEYFINAINLTPDNAYLYNNLGYAMSQLKQFDAAIECFNKTIALLPDYPPAYLNKGSALKGKHHFAEAIAQLDLAIQYKPDYLEAHSNQGNIYLLLRQTDAAIASFAKALTIQPSSFNVLNHMGTAYQQKGDLGTALDYYQQALQIAPDFADAQINIGSALLESKHTLEALEAYNRALEMAPGHPEAHFHRGLCLLQLGDLRNGWQDYEWRWKTSGIDSYRLPTGNPQFTGPNKTKRLLLWCEQGVGDEVMFASLFQHASLLADEILIKTDARLIPLLSRSFPNYQFFTREAQIDESLYDQHLPVASLCQFFLNDLSDFAKIPSPYLQVSEDLHRGGSGIFCAEKINCGVSWRSFNATGGLGKSLGIINFLSRLPLQKLNLINLQYGDISEDLDEARRVLGVEIRQYPGIDTSANLDGLASLIQACDQVVSIDNTTVHLAGALGKSQTILIGPYADWRWCIAGQRPLWYPNARFEDLNATGMIDIS